MLLGHSRPITYPAGVTPPVVDFKTTFKPFFREIDLQVFSECDLANKQRSQTATTVIF